MVAVRVSAESAEPRSAPTSPPSATPVLESGVCGCLRHDALINNYRFSASPFEPGSEKREKKRRTFSVCASWSFPLFRSESVSESPEGARHGTATGPARAERWEEKEGGRGRGRREGGGVT